MKPITKAIHIITAIIAVVFTLTATIWAAPCLMPVRGAEQEPDDGGGSGGGGVSRRRFLKRAAVGGLGILAAGTSESCAPREKQEAEEVERSSAEETGNIMPEQIRQELRDTVFEIPLYHGTARDWFNAEAVVDKIFDEYGKYRNAKFYIYTEMDYLSLATLFPGQNLTFEEASRIKGEVRSRYNQKTRQFYNNVERSTMPGEVQINPKAVPFAQGRARFIQRKCSSYRVVARVERSDFEVGWQHIYSKHLLAKATEAYVEGRYGDYRKAVKKYIRAQSQFCIKRDKLYVDRLMRDINQPSRPDEIAVRIDLRGIGHWSHMRDFANGRFKLKLMPIKGTPIKHVGGKDEISRNTIHSDLRQQADKGQELDEKLIDRHFMYVALTTILKASYVHDSAKAERITMGILKKIPQAAFLQFHKYAKTDRRPNGTIAVENRSLVKWLAKEAKVIGKLTAEERDALGIRISTGPAAPTLNNTLLSP